MSRGDRVTTRRRERGGGRGEVGAGLQGPELEHVDEGGWRDILDILNKCSKERV